MATTEEKFNLVLEAANLILRQDVRTSCLNTHLPKVSIVVVKDPDEKGSYDTTTEIRLEYPDGKIGMTANWDGLGRSVDEALITNMWSFQFEIEERLVEYQKMLARLKEAAPTNEK